MNERNAIKLTYFSLVFSQDYMYLLHVFSKKLKKRTSSFGFSDKKLKEMYPRVTDDPAPSKQEFDVWKLHTRYNSSC